MRRVVGILAGLVLLVPVLAFGGPDFDQIFADCDFWKYGDFADVTLDTLWFSPTQANAGSGLSFDATIEEDDWFGPALVPIGAAGDGSLLKEVRPVKKSLLYSRVPFTVHVYAQGSTTIPQFVATVDTLGMVGSPPHCDTFPCWTTISWPDSVYVAEAGSDSVGVAVGYGK